jgi:hypothetical protein
MSMNRAGLSSIFEKNGPNNPIWSQVQFQVFGTFEKIFMDCMKIL